MGGFLGFFGIFELFFFVAFFAVFGIIIATFVRAAKENHRNNQSPRLTVEATVVAKRTNYTRHNATKHSMAHTSTQYFVTFEVASGDRMELSMAGQEYGLLVEGDFGDLSFQGTRYLGFARKNKSYEDV